jgi:glutamate--cysteine ligase catalytic subunit
MGLLSEGTPLTWLETKKNADFVRNRGAIGFSKIYEKFHKLANSPFKWGDEVEFSLIKFDHEAKTCKLLLKANELLTVFRNRSNDIVINNPKVNSVLHHQEYASYMIEATPATPFDDDVNSLAKIDENMYLRRSIVQSLLDKDEYIISLTCFPRLGCLSFTSPERKPAPLESITQSLFFPDEAILKIHPRFVTLSRDIRERRMRKVAMYVPIYQDVKTAKPFLENLSPLLKELGVENEEKKLLYDPLLNEPLIKENKIYLDATGFGMGCCCLQTTFQTKSLDEARYLYDQLLPVTAIMLALSASSPVWRGYLADVDCRWSVISGSVDDRTIDEEKWFAKSRYDSVSLYLSKQNAQYNDLSIVKNEQVYKQLVEKKIDEHLATHIAHLFIRDPLVLFKEKLTYSGSNDDMNDMDDFENIQSTNWQSLRFKPPPLNQNEIGWRVEFRPMELQLTDLENAALCSFVILLTRAIQTFNINMTMPISKVDENMRVAQKRNACLGELFYFRENIFDVEADCLMKKMSINQIINGYQDEHGEFIGLLNIVKNYLNLINDQIEANTKCKLDKYLSLIEWRASGKLMTNASFIRNFIHNHPAYKQDSIVNEEINYDLLWYINKNLSFHSDYYQNMSINCSEFSRLTKNLFNIYEYKN